MPDVFEGIQKCSQSKPVMDKRERLREKPVQEKKVNKFESLL